MRLSLKRTGDPGGTLRLGVGMNEQSAFATALAFTLAWEGDYSDDPHDPGGATRFGISARAHPGLDIRHLDQAHARALYAREYWVGAGCDRLAMPLAVVHFDAAVQHGPRRAIRFLQEELKVAVDGLFGARTQAALAVVPAATLIEPLLARRRAFYAVQPAVRYHRGWRNRMDALTAFVAAWTPDKGRGDSMACPGGL